MPRPTEIAADARALYGPPSVRPAAGDMGDGALWVDPGDSQSLWQVQSGNWRQIALPPADVDTDDDSSVPAGVPVLRGPYVVDYTDIPHDGDTLTLWTPAVGDVLLALFADWQTFVAWTAGYVFIGQNVDGTVSPPLNVIVRSDSQGMHLDMGYQLTETDAAGVTQFSSAHVLATADPVQIQLAQTAGTPVTAGHVALYALVARAVAP